jgi:hypothetical protein
MIFDNIVKRHGYLCLFFVLSFADVSYAQCDTSMWRHVYWNKRLIIKKPCITVTGTVKAVINELDGDCHIRLKLDAGQDSLMNAKNYSKEDSCFVVEIICQHTSTQPGSGSACKGYVNNITEPTVGQHIKATGVYVMDNGYPGYRHGWMEIHPASKIEVITK